MTKPKNAGVPARIAEEIRDLVARGKLAPGVRLGQVELAARFKASRMAVREAIKLLSVEGILLHAPNRGFFVAQQSSSEARQLFRMRELIEDALLRSVRWPSNAELADLNGHAAELERLLNAGDRAGWWVRHREFHAKIFDLSPQKVLVGEAMRFWTLTDLYRSLVPLPDRSGAERSLVDKHPLVRALAQRDRRRLLKTRADRRVQFERLVVQTLESRAR